MNEQDFVELRSHVKQHTQLPEFDGVKVAARRRRRRQRLITTIGSLVAIAVFLPGLAYVGFALTSGTERPGFVEISVATGGDGTAGANSSVVTTAPSIGPVTPRLVAAGGVDMANAYGLVDACSPKVCNLQLISLSTDPTTERIGLLRSDSSQSIADPRVTALGEQTVLVGAEVGDSIGPKSQTLDLAQPDTTQMSQAVTPVQPVPYGRIQVARGADGVIHSIAEQPKLSLPMLASTSHGWWVTGRDTRSGQLSVSFSGDAGLTWRTTLLGVSADASTTPSLATVDGERVYVLARTHGHIVLIKSSDGGSTWASPVRHSEWDSSTQFGVMTPADGSVGVWLADGADSVVFRRSTNGGAAFSPVVGSSAPKGPVVTLPDGYVALGTHPSISTDGHTWQAIKMPFLAPS